MIENLPVSVVKPRDAFKLLAVKKMADVERMFMQYVIDECDGNLAAAAKYMGVARATIYRKVKEYGLTREK